LRVGLFCKVHLQEQKKYRARGRRTHTAASGRGAARAHAARRARTALRARRGAVCAGRARGAPGAGGRRRAGPGGPQLHRAPRAPQRMHDLQTGQLYIAGTKGGARAVKPRLKLNLLPERRSLLLLSRNKTAASDPAPPSSQPLESRHAIANNLTTATKKGTAVLLSRAIYRRTAPPRTAHPASSQLRPMICRRARRFL